jgi:ubiquinone biosynthesis protein COQ9
MPRKTSSSPHNDASRQKLLEAFLKHVPSEGWTSAALTAALRQTKLTRAEADRLFPQGITDIIDAFGAMIDAAMDQAIKTHRGYDRLRTRDKVTFAVRARLEALAPHREAFRRLMGYYAMPLHAPHAIQRFYKTVDRIWAAAGDTSTDYNFYTKRVLLGGVFKATLIFWLNDESPRHEATWDFLDRRIGDIMKLGKSLSLLKEFRPDEIVNFVRDKFKRSA